MLIVKRYTASWCQPCKQLTPVFESLENEMNNETSPVMFKTIDVDTNKEQVSQEGITSVPTVVLEKDGQIVYRFSGVLSKPVIAGIIKKFL